MNVVNSPWVWVVMSLVAGGLAPFVTPFNRVQEKRRTESRRQLAAMNEVQRQQLKRNEEAFSALSDTDRQKMRDFHRQMEGATKLKCSEFGDAIIAHM